MASLRSDLVEFLASITPEVVQRYERELRYADSPLLQTEASRQLCLAHARQILADLVQDVSDGVPRDAGPARTLSGSVGVSRAAQGIRPSESIRAAGALFDVVLDPVAEHAGSVDAVVVLARALNGAIGRAMRQSVDSYAGYLLNRVHQAQVDERRRVSRDLHDSVASGVSVAYRHLELFDVHLPTDPARAYASVAKAEQALRGTLESIRALISALRLVGSAQGLQASLEAFLESAAPAGLGTQVVVYGDESWAPAGARDEAFLIAREALRNVVAHARAGQVRIRIDITPDELRATVDDDGVGFDPHAASGGTGLASMRERAALAHGTLVVSSYPGFGTHVELQLPLPGENDGEDRRSDQSHRGR